MMAGDRRSRVRWRLRRGTKELDVLLERFAREALGHLDEAALERLERLLEEPDPDLLGWLTGGSLPEDEDLAASVRTIRVGIGQPS